MCNTFFKITVSKNLKTAKDHSVDNSALKEAVEYFKINQNLTPKVVNIKYLIDYETQQQFKTHQAVARWLHAIHGQVIVVVNFIIFSPPIEEILFPGRLRPGERIASIGRRLYVYVNIC